MESKIIYSLSLFLENKLSEEQLSKVQEFLLSGDIGIVASKFLAILIFFILFLPFCYHIMNSNILQ